MRVWLLVLTVGTALGGCITPTDSTVGDPGWTGPGGGPLAGCHTDTECGGTANVCARDGTCQAAASVHAVHVTWTLKGNAASEATCAHSADLQIEFTSNARDRLGFAPVPCRQGKFTIDKLPIWYNVVDLGLDSFGGYSSPIDRTTGNAAIDLPY